MNSWVVCPAMIGVDSASQKGAETPHCVISVHLDLLQEINFLKKMHEKSTSQEGLGRWFIRKLEFGGLFGGKLTNGVSFNTKDPKSRSGFLFEITDVNSVPDIWDHGLFFTHKQTIWLMDQSILKGPIPGPSAKSLVCFFWEVWSLGQLEVFEISQYDTDTTGEGNSCKARRQKLFTPED